MFESLSEKLEGALKSLSGQGRLNELNVATSMREIRRALLDADVNFQVARDFTNRIKEQVMGQEVLTSIAPGQMLVKIVYEALVDLLGGAPARRGTCAPLAGGRLGKYEVFLLYLQYLRS